MLKYVGVITPPPPYYKICDIFGNYERISTKISVIRLLAIGDKYLVKIFKYVTPLGSTPPHIVKYRSHKEQRINT